MQPRDTTRRRRSGGARLRRARRAIRATAVMVSAVVVAVLTPMRPAAAETAVACTHDTFETVHPGLTSESTAQHHNGAGTWVCSGVIVGKSVVGNPGPMDFQIRTEGNCLTERGEGTARARIPLARHDFALLRFAFTYTREGNAIAISVTDGTAEVDGVKDDLVWHGTLNATPTRGDCITEPVSAARVTGQLAGSGT